MSCSASERASLLREVPSCFLQVFETENSLIELSRGQPFESFLLTELLDKANSLHFLCAEPAKIDCF
jgi:hypothetical protein